MKRLTTKQIDGIIAMADECYEKFVGVAGDAVKYHEIASTVLAVRYSNKIYDAKIIDDRCIELAQIEMDLRVV